VWTPARALTTTKSGQFSEPFNSSGVTNAGRDSVVETILLSPSYRGNLCRGGFKRVNIRAGDDERVANPMIGGRNAKIPSCLLSSRLFSSRPSITPTAGPPRQRSYCAYLFVDPSAQIRRRRQLLFSPARFRPCTHYRYTLAADGKPSLTLRN